MKKIALTITALAFLAGAGNAGGSEPRGLSPEELHKRAAAEARPSAKTVQGTPASSEEAGVPDAMEQPNACWSVNWNMYADWGHWPSDQRVYENRYWCASYHGGPQTYRTSHVYLSGTWCEHNNPYAARSSGGNGYTWTTVRSGGHFSCPSGFPWFRWEYDNWMEWACNTWGSCSFVRAGRL